MISLILGVVALVCAGVPALLFLVNLRRYRRLPPLQATFPVARVSILIPARNEEKSIGAAVLAAAASEGVKVEVIVLDDHSDDNTAQRVTAIAACNPVVRLVLAPPLPDGWCGKQHACYVLANEARHDLLLFVDADARLAPDAAARMARFLDASGAALVSGVPRQETGTLFEKLLIPLIHFILLGFLPVGRMRASAHPAYAAGCGQLFLARRDAYSSAGGHAAIRASLHDGLALPRAFRLAGFRTDLFDATDVATCRMYRSAAEVWAGLAKNATEGLADPRRILPATLILLGGQVLPVALLAASPWLPGPVAVVAGLATFFSYAPRLAGIFRFRQSVPGALLHPVGVAVLVLLQWFALARALARRPAAWKGRHYGLQRSAQGVS